MKRPLADSRLPGLRALLAVPISATLVGVVLSCGGPERAPAADQGALPEGVLAQVGGELIQTETVASIAQRQKIGLRQARDRAVFDALFAAEARRAVPHEARAAAARVLSRALVRQIWRDARNRPISDAELAEATASQFVALDRPPGWRVVHFVVRTYDRYSQKKRDRAQRLAGTIRERVVAVAKAALDIPPPERPEPQRFILGTVGRKIDPAVDRFQKAVKTVDPKGLEVVAEELGVLALDSRIIDYANVGEVVDPKFTAALPDLHQRGDLSEVVQTQFGYHVMLLLERTAAKRVPRAERVEQLRAKIQVSRARQAQTALLEVLSGRAGVKIKPNADAVLGQLRVTLDDAPGPNAQ